MCFAWWRRHEQGHSNLDDWLSRLFGLLNVAPDTTLEAFLLMAMMMPVVLMVPAMLMAPGPTLEAFHLLEVVPVAVALALSLAFKVLFTFSVMVPVAVALALSLAFKVLFTFSVMVPAVVSMTVPTVLVPVALLFAAKA